MISDDVATFLESGISILIGTRDDLLRPDAMRGCGARVLPGGEQLLVLFPEATGATAFANLRANGRIAITFSRPSDHRSLQVKGHVVELRSGGDAERAIAERQRRNFAQELATVGVPARITMRMTCWPAHVARVQVAAVFVQTPGPGAGNAYGAPRGASGQG